MHIETYRHFLYGIRLFIVVHVAALTALGMIFVAREPIGLSLLVTGVAMAGGLWLNAKYKPLSYGDPGQ